MRYKFNKIVTVEELMELLHIGKNTAYGLLESGEIQAFRIGRRWKIEKKAICEYIQKKYHQNYDGFIA